MFAGEWLACASMNRVAQVCGISKANKYHYYDSEDAILVDLLDSYLINRRDQI
ncbi:MAG: hypothetical protein GY717_05500 [Rhodobacteraceae bacterium]|nr:hypothetical protein [Paracoccaceae bacterium]